MSETKLYKIPYLTEGWTGVANENFKRINALFRTVNAFINVDVGGGPSNGQTLKFDEATQKWKPQSNTV